MTTRLVKLAFVALTVLVAGLCLASLCLSRFLRDRAAEAQQTVAVAVNHLRRGELVTNLHLDESLSRSDLSLAFAKGYRSMRYDNIAPSLNGFEVMVDISDTEGFRFDAYKIGGAWQLYCCAHWREDDGAQTAN